MTEITVTRYYGVTQQALVLMPAVGGEEGTYAVSVARDVPQKGVQFSASVWYIPLYKF